MIKLIPNTNDAHNFGQLLYQVDFCLEGVWVTYRGRIFDLAEPVVSGAYRYPRHLGGRELILTN